MSQMFPVDSFEQKKNTFHFYEDFIQIYGEDSGIGYILEIDFKYPQQLHKPHNDLPFLSGRMKINSCKKIIFNLYDKKDNVLHKLNFKAGV